jgi:uncharacterized protein YybS (DUF2232 family)
MTNGTPLASRGLTGLGAALFAGGLSVAFLVTALMHADSPFLFLGYFTGLPLYLAGLGGGAMAGLVASITGALILLITQPSKIAFYYVFIFAVPAVVVCMLALRYRVVNGQIFWYPESRLMTAITLYPCAIFIGLVALTSGHPGGLLGLTQQAFAQFSTEAAQHLGEDQADMFQTFIDQAAHVAPAMLSFAWIFVTLISLLGAQHILRKQKWTLREEFNIKNLHMPTYLIYAIVVTGLLGVFGATSFAYVGRNLSMVLGLPAFFVGLAVLHAFTASIKYGMAILIIVYTVLSILPFMALPIAAFGLADPWVDFRKRIAQPTTV